MKVRKKIDILNVCEALLALGHTGIWLREVSEHRFLITWDNLTVAHYDSYRQSWSLCKYADVVNDNPDDDKPSGDCLTHIPDAAIAFQLMQEGY
ncbi:hypothetical protein GQG59_004251 [Salmonella enterica]|uniref:Uncharacterized protein n=1 Tax=Salmonella enterica TaxID=28901 RepID=A0A5Y9YBZ0_SALER|nr:hypothetical protein [Salmonella enterica]EDX7317154.1 hypothetical protein [Salmonella enterica subsp. enterica serovar Alabama]SUI05115.1 Uncharacterised protein [Salmonella enterica subsp. enterica]ECP1741141.1 hypothetical protein [Salmonella enterica]ECQ8329267.1 hypothetical protein [Salmonella enterica]